MSRRLLAGLVIFGAALAIAEASDAQGYRLYCDQLGAYYPDVTSCPTGWHNVMPGYGAVPAPLPPGAYVPEPGAYPAAPYPAYPPNSPYAPPVGYPPPGSYPPPPAPAYASPPPNASPPGAQPPLPPPARESSEAAHAANLESAAEIGMRREQDAADGYREVALANVLEHFKALRGGIIVTGYYSLAEDHAALGEAPDSESRIFVATDKLSKNARGVLANCDGCRITVWARKGCSKAAAGEDAACVVVDRLKKETYEAATPIYR